MSRHVNGQDVGQVISDAAPPVDLVEHGIDGMIADRYRRLRRAARFGVKKGSINPNARARNEPTTATTPVSNSTINCRSCSRASRMDRAFSSSIQEA